MRIRRLAAAVAAGLVAVAMLAGCGSTDKADAGSGGKKTINVAAPQCAHCLAMYLLDGKVPGYKVNVSTFKDLASLEASLASGKVAVAQIDYTGLLSMIDKGAPIEAISGEVNGGSDFVVSPKLKLAADDWPAFKALVAARKKSGEPLKIASQFGTVQDIELRLELPAKGISNSDVDYVNVPYQGMAQALTHGSVQAAIPVQPVAATITNTGAGAHFAYPYDQAAGNLTNVVVANKSYAASHPKVIEAMAKGLSNLVAYLPTSQGQADWAAAIKKYSGTNDADTKTAMAQLKPDLTMPFSQIVAVAHAMYEQKLITHDFTEDQLKKYVDYAPLAKATGKTPTQLGYSS